MVVAELLRVGAPLQLIVVVLLVIHNTGLHGTQEPQLTRDVSVRLACGSQDRDFVELYSGLGRVSAALREAVAVRFENNSFG